MYLIDKNYISIYLTLLMTCTSGLCFPFLVLFAASQSEKNEGCNRSHLFQEDIRLRAEFFSSVKPWMVYGMETLPRGREAKINVAGMGDRESDERRKG